jgi:mannose-1-phosphate guanylyltransferase
MLQATMRRLDGLHVSSSVVICNDDHKFFVAEQLREINRADTIILEPTGRNTAPAVALAALAAGDDPLLLVLPADHLIRDEAAFRNVVTEALPLAESGRLVTFGIVQKGLKRDMGISKKASKMA